MGYNENGQRSSPLNQHDGRNYHGHAQYQNVMDEYSKQMGPEKRDLYAGPANINFGERQR